jgi:hypothetical protein
MGEIETYVRVDTETSVGVSTSIQHNHFHVAEVTNLTESLNRLNHCTCKLSLVSSHMGKQRRPILAVGS